MEACPSDVQLSKSISLKLMRGNLASLARRRQTGRGAARESCLSRSKRNASKRERRCRQKERPRAGCDSAALGGMDRNRVGPSGSERGILVMCRMLRGQYHDATNTLPRRTTKRLEHSDTTLPNPSVVEGTAKPKLCKPTDGCECSEEVVGPDECAFLFRLSSQFPRSFATRVPFWNASVVRMLDGNSSGSAALAQQTHETEVEAQSGGSRSVILDSILSFSQVDGPELQSRDAAVVHMFEGWNTQTENENGIIGLPGVPETLAVHATGLILLAPTRVLCSFLCSCTHRWFGGFRVSQTRLVRREMPILAQCRRLVEGLDSRRK